MATLREIRKKLHSVQNVKKITQAMEMVAGARLRRVQARTENARPYLQELKLILNNLLASSDDLSHPLIEQRPVKRVSVIVIGGDKGLCGSYNNNILTEASTFLKQYEPENVDLVLVGHKIIAPFVHKNWNVTRTLVDWGQNISVKIIEELSAELINSFIKKRVDEVWVVYTHFQNIMTRKVVVEKLLNIELKPQKNARPKNASKKDASQKDANNENTQAQLPSNYIFEPSQQDIFEAILPRYFSSMLQLALNEAFTSELAARILAMRAATKNADEMAEELTLVRNKLRQTGITREIIEITSGAEASKSF